MRLPRLVQSSNFRDLGGYRAGRGRTVKWGQLFRAGGTPLLSDEDLATIRKLGLMTMVDLRSTEERALAPTRLAGLRYIAWNYPLLDLISAVGGPDALHDGSAIYRVLPAMMAPQLREVFDAMLSEKTPILWSCSGGQDRTGVVSALVLASLGVARDAIDVDYLLSTELRRPQFELPEIDPAALRDNPAHQFVARMKADPLFAVPRPLRDPQGIPFLASAFDVIEVRYGTVTDFLRDEIGLRPRNFNQLRERFTH